jgi:Transcriptional regulator containing PAS, AAA-type ATPase, and DNA-binding domains
VQRLGSLKGTPIDVRLVAATNRALEKEVRDGRFREDLYYRINVIRVRIPPLRERPEDIPLLAGAFLARISGAMGRKAVELGDEAIHFLMRYEFPGNVRELENAIERACILSESDTLRARDFEFLKGGKVDWAERSRARNPTVSGGNRPSLLRAWRKWKRRLSLRPCCEILITGKRPPMSLA